jgi:hypothetical protein
MKTKLFILVALIVCFSCGTNNKPVSDVQKEKIKSEVKEVVNTIIKGCEEANYEMVIESYFDSPDFVFIYNGTALSYKEIEDITKTQFNTFLNQKITIINEKCAILDNSTVLYTVNDKCLMNYKDGHSSLADPETMLFMFKKINNRWRVIYGVDSYVEKIVKYSEPSKELNQVKLFKQMIGTWKGEIARDTFYFAQYKPFGNGLEGNIKIVTGGKKIMEGKVLLGYDKKNDKFIETDLVEGSDIMIYGIWFTSKSTLTEVPWEDILNPEKTPVIWKYEIKSPDVFVWNNIENNKTTFSYNFHREK